MKAEIYLNFDGRCEEALEFYKKAIGAEVTMMLRFNQSPEPCPEGMLPPGTPVVPPGAMGTAAPGSTTFAGNDDLSAFSICCVTCDTDNAGVSFVGSFCPRRVAVSFSCTSKKPGIRTAYPSLGSFCNSKAER